MHEADERQVSLLAPLPLIQQALTTKLSGADGSNREPKDRCQINANNDYEALQAWLNEYRHQPATLRTYQKEGERLLLWAISEQQKPLSSLNRDDLEAYLTFLDDPQPRDKWCTKVRGRGCKRGDPDWRPFNGGLSHSAKMTAISAIDSLLHYLVDARYLAFNPLSLIRKKRFQKNAIPREFTVQDRILSPDEWHSMLMTLHEYPETSSAEKREKERLKFLIAMLYLLGLRINELATHQWNAFRKVDECWWFYVIGKGGKPAKIPVNDELLRAVITYRAYLKKSPYPTAEENTPLITSFTTGNALTARQINKLLKALAYATAEKFSHSLTSQKKLRKFSAHWLRHLSATMQDKAGIAFKHIRDNHRHENDETTRLYVHTHDKERHQDMQKLKFPV